jgi:hypothetical protein
MVSIQLPYHSDKNQTPFINVFRHWVILAAWLRIVRLTWLKEILLSVIGKNNYGMT